MTGPIRRALARLVSALLPPVGRLRERNARLQRKVDRQRATLRRVTVERASDHAHVRAELKEERQQAKQRESALSKRVTILRGRRALHAKPGDPLRATFAGSARMRATADLAPDASERERRWTAASQPYTAEVSRIANGEHPARAHAVEIGGLTWWLPEDAATSGSLSRRITDRGWLPFDDVARVRRLVVGGGMLDIGANVGTTAIPRAVLGDFAVVYAAEPDPDNYACLVANVLSHKLGGVVLPDLVALSSSTGPLRLRRTTHFGTHHLLPAGQKGHLPSIEVCGYTVDDWIARLGAQPAHLSFVKVDAQGWDVHVMLGARSLLAMRHAVWQVEFSPVMMDRTGAGVREFAALVADHFTHFRTMDEDERDRPVAQVGELGAAFKAGGYTNLLLYNRA